MFMAEALSWKTISVTKEPTDAAVVREDEEENVIAPVELLLQLLYVGIDLCSVSFLQAVRRTELQEVHRNITFGKAGFDQLFSFKDTEPVFFWLNPKPMTLANLCIGAHAFHIERWSRTRQYRRAYHRVTSPLRI